MGESIQPSPLKMSFSMPDDFTSTMSLLIAAVLVVLSLLLSWYLRRDPVVRSLHLPYLVTVLKRLYHPQLNAIPTIGFSDPILSYFSALQFNLDGERMLQEGYEKVNFFSLFMPFLQLTTMLIFRQIRVYSRLPTFGDGWSWPPDLS